MPLVYINATGSPKVNYSDKEQTEYSKTLTLVEAKDNQV